MTESHETSIEAYSRDFYKRTRYDREDIGRVGRELAQKHELEFIDNGHACVVVKEKGEDRHVIAFSAEDISPEKAQETFLTQTVLSRLFPYNFPQFHAAFHTDARTEQPGGQIREHIKRGDEMIYGFSKTYEKLREIGLNVWLDESPGNFLLGRDGGQYYVDVPRIPGNRRDWNKEKILKHMKTEKRQDGRRYTEDDIQIVHAAINTLAHMGAIKITR